MNSEPARLPSDAELRFRDAMRRILSLTPEQRDEVKRKVAAEAQRPKREADEQHPVETPGG